MRAVNPPFGRALPALLALALVFGAACSREPAHAGRTLDQWLADASGDDAPARTRAIDAFRQWGNAGVDELLKAIRAAGSRVEDADTDEGRRAQRAFNVLMQLSPDQRAATDALVKLLNEYYTAGEAALYLAGTSPTAIPLLTNALASPHRITRVAATAALGTFTNRAPDVLPAIFRALHDEHYTVRVMAVASLSSFEPTPDIVVALAERLGDRSYTVRGTSARTLGSFGPAAREAVPALTKALENRPDSNRDEAADALRKIAPGVK